MAQPENEASGVVAKQRAAGGWYAALLMSGSGIIPLCWILARLIWLPMYMGLFFFVIAGLLVGAASFRLASRARPLSRWRIIQGSGVVAVVAGAAFVIFEYEHFANTVGDPPHFAEAKNAALSQGRSARSVEGVAANEFRKKIADSYPPGGALGYVRWAISSNRLQVALDLRSEVILMPHAGFRWILRTVAAVVLLGIGMYLSFDALRSGERVSNILAVGEPYEEEF